MTPSKTLLFILLSFIGGVFISSFFEVPQLIIYELLMLGVFYGLVFFRQKAIIIFAVCLIISGLGIWRTNFSKEKYLDTDTGLTRATATARVEPVQSSGKLSGLKQRFRGVINGNLSPPQSSMLAAILLGDKDKISKEWKEKLNRAGVRHITAVSGMHIVILSGILLWLGISLGLWRGQAFYFALIFLWLFILMIGFQPSAVRAGIMGSLFLFCQKIGRQRAAGRTLALTAGVMLAFNPLLLRHNVGFQLSFLATLGIIYLMPFFQMLFQALFTKLRLQSSGFRNLIGLLSMTFAAQIFTLPVLIYNFGYVSLVSPITNLLIVPLLSYLMVVGFLLTIFGAIWQPLAFIFLFPVWLLLTYITKIVDLFSNLSFSSVGIQISWLWLPVFYSLLGFLLWQIKKRQKLKLLP